MNNVRKSIGWCDYTINPVKGLCPVGCSYCYARAIYKRFGMDETIRFEPFKKPMRLPKKPSRIFVGSTMELFGEWISEDWLNYIFTACNDHPEHTFIFLTKCPENLPQWLPFPDNYWVGVSCENQKMFTVAADYLAMIDAPVKFISFEPLLGRIDYGGTAWQELMLSGINWIIVGQQTPVKKTTMPELDWIKDIVQGADEAAVPVFLKDNLDSLLGQDQRYKKWQGTDEAGNNLYGLRQEFPND